MQLSRQVATATISDRPTVSPAAAAIRLLRTARFFDERGPGFDLTGHESLGLGDVIIAQLDFEIGIALAGGGRSQRFARLAVETFHDLPRRLFWCEQR